jgi:hypothetical protein
MTSITYCLSSANFEPEHFAVGLTRESAAELSLHAHHVAAGHLGLKAELGDNGEAIALGQLDLGDVGRMRPLDLAVRPTRSRRP